MTDRDLGRRVGQYVCTYVRGVTKDNGVLEASVGIQVLFEEYCTEYSFYPILLDPCDNCRSNYIVACARAPRRAEGQTSRTMRAQRYDTHVTKSCARIPTKPT